jgi:hypothetical protein
MYWAKWNGTSGEQLQSDDKGYLNVEGSIRISGGEVNYNSHGFYQAQSIQPTLGADQIKGVVEWSFEDGVITREWAVRDLTPTEILERDAAPMSMTNYNQWRAIQILGGWSDITMANNMTDEEVASFVARRALEAA